MLLLYGPPPPTAKPLQQRDVCFLPSRPRIWALSRQELKGCQALCQGWGMGQETQMAPAFPEAPKCWANGGRTGSVLLWKAEHALLGPSSPLLIQQPEGGV